jgi:hypothetical protein
MYARWCARSSRPNAHVFAECRRAQAFTRPAPGCVNRSVVRLRTELGPQMFVFSNAWPGRFSNLAPSQVDIFVRRPSARYFYFRMCHRLAWRLPAFRHTSSRPSREILPVQTQDMSAMTASAATTRVADLGARRTNAVRGAGRRVVASASRRVASVTSAEYKARPGRRRAISRFPRVL